MHNETLIDACRLAALLLLILALVFCRRPHSFATPDDRLTLFRICAQSYNTRQALEILRDDIRSYWLDNLLTPAQQLQARDIIYYIESRLRNKDYETK